MGLPGLKSMKARTARGLGMAGEAEVEAELVAATRLEGRSLADLAAEQQVPYKTLAKRRERAEARLARALTGRAGAEPAGLFAVAAAPGQAGPTAAERRAA
ncbi:lambda repressor-like predicted transcriptional regulator [Spinactinospora alkalitolerans]|uniref:Lambda repressor-like predicted transcriptional regulator n=1 Tax=Spinactinospora alkalitolerans TaxID=687207 RepID=A0A852U2M3_9ACTN|nr:hypothetical protein [Spinactinospora alkalitolerans]NYE50478.1 lambda repressor-like predicted transcriptional regulator [Spinactinospora alkalitolerans]